MVYFLIAVIGIMSFAIGFLIQRSGGIIPPQPQPPPQHLTQQKYLWESTTTIYEHKPVKIEEFGITQHGPEEKQ